MYLSKTLGFFAVVVTLFLLPSNGFAATVTVNATAAPVPGSIYSTIGAAMDNVAGGDTWGDGTDDTVLVTDDGVLIEAAQVTVHAAAGGSITIRNNPGDTPVVTLVPDHRYVFRVNETINATIDGLTIIGSEDGPSDTDSFAAFGLEASDPSFVVNVTIKNCVVTRNKGGNVPELDYSAPFEQSGTLHRAIYHGDDPYRGLLNVTVEDCVFAFFTPHGTNTAIQFERQVDPENPNETPTRVLTLRRVLLTKVGEPEVSTGHGIRTRDVGPETTVNIIDSCIIGVTGRCLLVGRNDLAELGGTFNVIHSILDDTGGTPAPINIDSSFGSDRWTGTLTVDGLTVARPGGDLILIEGAKNGDGNYDLKNCISVAPDDSLFRLLPEDGITKPASFVVSNINSDGDAARATQHPDIIAAFAADYGGAGTFHDDPMFISTVIDSSYTGIRKWDSTTNTLYDVNNPSFSGKGSGGSNLVGGAECPACGTGVNDWNLY